MSPETIYLVVGAALLLAAVLPGLLTGWPLSAPMVLLPIGVVVGAAPGTGNLTATLLGDVALVEHLTAFCVIVALMGVGLALDRPLDLLRPSTWRGWGATWRLLGLAMPLTIIGIALLGAVLMGLDPAAALLLGAALAPTDPVLASDVQVAGPTTEVSEEEIDEEDEVRFALTSEAGLNDGLAFPFVLAALLLASGDAAPAEWVLRDVLLRTLVGVAVGWATGQALARLAFRGVPRALRLAERGEPLMALAAVLLSYGAAELAGGYAFVAVFICATTIRAADPGHAFHGHLHATIERLERLLTVLFLLVLGVALTDGLLTGLSWGGVAVAVALVFVVRPAAGLFALSVRARPGGPADRVGHRVLGPRERCAVAFLGIRGVASVYYLAYAAGRIDLDGQWGSLWATVGFAVTLSVLVHGMASTPVMRWLERSA